MIILGIVGGIILLIVAIVFLSGFCLVGDNQVGILTRKMFGKKLPEGQIIARDGEIGIQAQTLMPGLYWRFPLFWKIRKAAVVDINTDEIGVVESVDGNPITTGRLLGDEIECDSFQNARKFLKDGGKKGPQVAILKPGSYRINTSVFTIQKRKITQIPSEKVGIIVALDGIPLPTGYIIARKPKEETAKDKSHNFFQNGQAFLNSEGYRGPQEDTMQPGEYYINPLLFQIRQIDVAEVPPGYVAVLRSNIGKELERRTDAPTGAEEDSAMKQPIHEAIETLLIPDRNTRGIWKEPVAPGKYNLNTIAFTPYLVPTSAVTIDWASGAEIRSEILGQKPKSVPAIKERPESEKATEFFKFSQLKVTSKDGFLLDVDVRMVIRIQPSNAAFIIARFGSVANLIEQIVHPLIDSSFRNKAGEEKAIEFIQGRTKLQQDALKRAREEFAQYNVEAQNLLIAYINVAEALLETQTKKEIALQQQAQYGEEAKAREREIEVKEKEARSAKQKDVIEAKLEIDIKTDKAQASRKEAEGIRDSTKIKAEGDAEKERIVGKGIADAYRAQVEALSGDDAKFVVAIKLIKEIADGNVKITPDILVSGGDGQGANLFNAFIANLLGKEISVKQTPPKS